VREHDDWALTEHLA
jgi:hypothetical protein